MDQVPLSGLFRIPRGLSSLFAQNVEVHGLHLAGWESIAVDRTSSTSVACSLGVIRAGPRSQGHTNRFSVMRC